MGLKQYLQWGGSLLEAARTGSSQKAHGLSQAANVANQRCSLQEESERTHCFHGFHQYPLESQRAFKFSQGVAVHGSRAILHDGKEGGD